MCSPLEPVPSAAQPLRPKSSLNAAIIPKIPLIRAQKKFLFSSSTGQRFVAKPSNRGLASVINLVQTQGGNPSLKGYPVQIYAIWSDPLPANQGHCP